MKVSPSVLIFKRHEVIIENINQVLSKSGYAYNSIGKYANRS